MKKITKIDGNKGTSIIKPKLRVAAYCRVSTGSDEQLVSLQAQKSHYETYIKANPEWLSLLSLHQGHDFWKTLDT